MREKVLNGFKSLGWFVIVSKKESNGLWVRLKHRDGREETISLWLDDSGYNRFEFENWD